MLQVIFIMLFSYLGPGVLLTEIKEIPYEPVPESSSFFILDPKDVVLDGQGRLIVVDAEVKTLFVWDQKRKFLKTLGKPGEGPGEFSFAGDFTNAASMYLRDGVLYVYDGGRHRVTSYDSELNFKETKNFDLGLGHLERLRQLDNGKYVAFYRRPFGRPAVIGFGFMDADAKVTSVEEMKEPE